jgi:hypothetical protein
MDILPERSGGHPEPADWAVDGVRRDAVIAASGWRLVPLPVVAERDRKMRALRWGVAWAAEPPAGTREARRVFTTRDEAAEWAAARLGP